MSNCNELADYEWLIGTKAAELAADLADSTEPLHRSVERLRRAVSAARAHLIVELVDLRHRARAKFDAADRMFFTRKGLEQATDQWVGAYKARRFAHCPQIADLCCGIGGDALALAAAGPIVGVDSDPVATLLSDANARAVLPRHLSERTTFRVADVEQCDSSGVAAWHIDPDRRPNTHRTTSLAWSSPNLQVLEQLLNTSASAAIKLAPAARPPSNWEEKCELEWISRGGECRQLVAWHGNLAQHRGQHSATIVSLHLDCESRSGYSPPLDGEGIGEGCSRRTIIGTPNQSVPIAGAVDRFIFDVDPAVLAAHLKGALAAEHKLCALGAGATYLTGPTTISNDAAMDCFEVVDVVPLRERMLADYFRDRGIGRLEIKKRGVDIDVEKLRREFKLRGDNEATLLLTPIGGRPTAIVARR